MKTATPSASRALLWTVVWFAAPGASASGGDDAAIRAAANSKPDDCIPRAAREHLAITRLGDTPALCQRPSEPVQTLAARCWELDLARGRVSRLDASAIPGMSLPASVDGGCVGVWCPDPPLPEGPGDGPLIARSTDQAHVALRVGCGLFVFDSATAAQVARVDLCGGEGGRFPLGEMVFVGDRLYLPEVAGGPFVGVEVFDVRGAFLGNLGTAGSHLSVFDGSMSALDSTHFGASSTGLLSLSVVDAAGQTRTLQRTTPLNPCTPGELESDFEWPSHPRCKAFLERHVYPYVDAKLVQLPDGNFLALLDGGSVTAHRWAGTLALLDGRTLAEKRRFEPRWCR